MRQRPTKRTYSVTFVGDFFILTTTVEAVITDDNDDNEATVIALADERLGNELGLSVADIANDILIEEIIPLGLPPHLVGETVA